MAGSIESVLFACNFNAVRSPIALGLARHLFGARIRFDSVGVRPGGVLDSFSVFVMAECGIDISGHQAKSFEEMAETSFDLVITLTPEAQHICMEMTRTTAVEIEYWNTYDPTLTLGSRDTIVEAYRGVRDTLRRAIESRFGAP